MWATPTTRDWRSDSSQKTSTEIYGAKGRPLSRQVWERGRQAPRSGVGGTPSCESDPNSPPRMWQTPRTGAHGVPGADATHGGQPKGMRLNPLFVEGLMGFPVAWTDSRPLGMPPFREWQRSHGGPFAENSHE